MNGSSLRTPESGGSPRTSWDSLARTAEKLHLSHHAVGAHLKHVHHKLDSHSRVEPAVLAMPHRG